MLNDSYTTKKRAANKLRCTRATFNLFVQHITLYHSLSGSGSVPFVPVYICFVCVYCIRTKFNSCVNAKPSSSSSSEVFIVIHDVLSSRPHCHNFHFRLLALDLVCITSSLTPFSFFHSVSLSLFRAPSLCVFLRICPTHLVYFVHFLLRLELFWCVVVFAHAARHLLNPYLKMFP